MIHLFCSRDDRVGADSHTVVIIIVVLLTFFGCHLQDFIQAALLIENELCDSTEPFPASNQRAGNSCISAHSVINKSNEKEQSTVEGKRAVVAQSNSGTSSIFCLTQEDNFDDDLSDDILSNELSCHAVNGVYETSVDAQWNSKSFRPTSSHSDALVNKPSLSDKVTQVDLAKLSAKGLALCHAATVPSNGVTPGDAVVLTNYQLSTAQGNNQPPPASKLGYGSFSIALE